MLGFGHTIPKLRANPPGTLQERISAIFAAQGYTLLSAECAAAVDDAFNDPANAYLKYMQIRALYNSAGFTELSSTCNYNLDKSML